MNYNEKEKVVCGIFLDIGEHLKTVLTGMGVTFDQNKRGIELILTYLDITNKYVDNRNRNVIFSKELSEKLEKREITDEAGNKVDDSKFQEVSDLIYRFKSKFENGEDINNHLSIGIFRDNEDYILNNWNLRHLHLSNIEKNVNPNDMKGKHGNRSGWLLFFILDNTNVYFVDVLRHPKGAGFTAYRFVQIFHRNGWMNLIGFSEIGEGYEPYSLQPNIKNDEDIFKLYESKMNIAFDIEGTGYGNINPVVMSGYKSGNVYFLNKLRKDLLSILDDHEYVEFRGDQGKSTGTIVMKDSENQLVGLPIDIH